MKKFCLCIAFIFSPIVFADIDVPDEVMQQVVADVMAEEGFYDAAEIDARVREWQVDQPQPEASGDLVETGTCAASCVQTGGSDALPMPRNVKIKGKESNGSLDKHIVITWKRPVALPEGSDLKLKRYKVIVSKDGQTFKKYKVKTKYKANGKPKKKQKLKLRNLEDGQYTVQVKAIYKSDSTSQSKTHHLAASTEGSGGSSSGWSQPEFGNIGGSTRKVSVLQSDAVDLYNCVIDHGQVEVDGVKSPATDDTNLSDITHLTCIDEDLGNQDVAQFIHFSGLVKLNLKNNPKINDSTFLSAHALSSLSWLDLSQNPGLKNNLQTALTHLSSLETVYIRKMDDTGYGLTYMPAIPDSLEFLSINDNNLDDADVFPDGTELETFIMDRNEDEATDTPSNQVYNITNDFFINTNNVSIRTIKIRSSALTNVSAFNNIKGLENLDLRWGSFAAAQDFSYLAGLCSMNMKGMDMVESLSPARPIQYLTIDGLNSLKSNDLINDPQFMPHQTSVTGVGSLQCSNRFSSYDNFQIAPTFKDKMWPDNNIPFTFPDGSTPSVPVCSLYIENLPSIHIEEGCKPDAPIAFNVYDDAFTAHRLLTWDMGNESTIDQWNIVRYEIDAYLDTQIYNSFSVDANDEKKLITFADLPNKYVIRACNDTICGYETEINALSFKQGLTRPYDPTVRWDNLNDGSFRFKFKYPDEVFNNALNPFGKPHRFIISDNSSQPGSDVLIEVLSNDQNGNCVEGDLNVPCEGDSGWWYSELIPANTFVSRSFNIKACRDDIGCSSHLNFVFDPQVVSEDLPVPGFSFASNDVYSGTEISLIISLSNLLGNTNHDYIEITETQPVIDAHRIIGESSQSNTNIITYFEDISDFDTANPPNQLTVPLTRLVKGRYDFQLKLCHRDRVNGDVCSSPSEVQTVELYRQDVILSEIAPPNTINIIELRYQSSVEKTIAWDEPSLLPDYYSVRVSPGGLNACGVSSASFKKYVERSQTTTYLVDLDDRPDDIPMVSSHAFCPTPVDGNRILVRSCFKGIGCSTQFKEITFSDDPRDVTGHAELDEPPRTTSNGNNQTSNLVGGPGVMRPGVWWNPQMKGTGWHFYWASDLRYPSIHENYGETYDLIGVWLTYQMIGDKWSPTWTISRLKAVGEASSNTDCTNIPIGCDTYFVGDLTYFTRDMGNGALSSENLGSIKVFFDSEGQVDSNLSVYLKLDVDSDNGLFTMPVANAGELLMQDGSNCNIDETPINDCLSVDVNGNLNIPLSNFERSLIGNGGDGAGLGTENDIDHYSGLWSARQSVSDEIDTEFSHMFDITRDLEWSALLFYDSLGRPYWALKDTCHQHADLPPGVPTTGCRRTDEGNEPEFYYTVNEGFDPMFYTPNEWWEIENNMVVIGDYLDNTRKFKRDSNDEDFNRMSMYINVNTATANQNLGRTASLSKSAVELSKSASFHDIRFFVNDQHDSIRECDMDTAEGGQCNIRFQWFTDDDFPTIHPFYRKNNEPLRDLQELCTLGVDSGHYVETNYTCVIYEEGVYEFELHKDKYDGTGTVKIAHSNELTIDGCDDAESECQQYVDRQPPFEVVEDPDLIGSMSTIMPHMDGSGNVPGEGGVSGGAATYSIPLSVLPGINGMTPNISFNYSSKGGNGIMGRGWSVTSGSSITHCPKTMAQDDQNVSITFTEKDRLCLNGQRLMLVSDVDDGSTLADTAYWEVAAEYRTEIDSFVKVVKTGAGISSGFDVYSKSGRISSYVKLGLVWVIESERDSFKNIIEYDYSTDHGENEVLLSTITYTGRIGSHASIISGDRVVEFQYGPRGKAYGLNYQFNQKTESTKRLNKVFIKHDSEIHRTYELSYKQGAEESLLLLESITERGTDNTPRVIAEIEWQGSKVYSLVKPDHNLSLNGFQFTQTMAQNVNDAFERQQNGVIEPVNLFKESISSSIIDANTYGSTVNNYPYITDLSILSDYNGDGSKELLATTYTGQGELNYMLMFYDVNGDDIAQISIETDDSILLKTAARGRRDVDFNGDGITDILFRGADNYYIAYWNGNGFGGDFETTFRVVDTGIPYSISQSNVFNTNMQPADLDNDGDFDLVYSRHVRFDSDNLCEPLTPQSTTTVRECTLETFYLENTGLVETCQNNVCVVNPSFTSTSVKINTSVYNTSFEIDSDKLVSVKDLNGDGNVDILISAATYASQGSLSLNKIYFSNGQDENGVIQFVAKLITEIGLENIDDVDIGLRDTFNLFTDVNGDGLEDYLYVEDPTIDEPAEWKYQLNTGDYENSVLFSSPQSTGATGHEYGLPQTQLDCELTEYGGVPGRVIIPQKCAPRRSNGLLLADVNGDGISDLLLPDPNDVLIDVCMDVNLLPDGSGFWINNQTSQDHPVNMKICANSANGDTNQDLEVFDFYSKGFLIGLDRSVYGHEALVFESTHQASGVTINLSKDLSLPTIYKRIGSGSVKQLDLFGDGDVDYTGLVECPYWFNPTDSNQDRSLQCSESAITFDDSNTVLLNYFSNTPGYSDLSVTAAKELLADNIVFDFLEAGDPDFIGHTGEFIITRNDSQVSGLIHQITQPTTGKSIQWTYEPLSTLSTNRPEFPLYSMPDRFSDDSYVDEDNLAGEHYYFNSSMLVVSEQRKSTGKKVYEAVDNYLGDSWSVNQYAYEEAVYNNKGRGFQGFRTIKIKTIPDVYHPSSNTSESISVFHQVFPIAGKLESIQVKQNTSNGLDLVESSVFNWSGNNQSIYGANGVFFVPMEQSQKVSYDYNEQGEREIIAEHVTSFDGSACQLSSGYDSYGNVLCEFKSAMDLSLVKYDDDNDSTTMPVDRTIQKTVTSKKTNIYNAPNIFWWVTDQLASSRIETSINHTGSYPLPTDYNSNELKRTTDSVYFWVSNSSRELECQFTSGNQIIGIITGCDYNLRNPDLVQKSFSYDVFGNVQSSTSSGVMDYQEAITHDRTVTSTYQTDGYFVANIDNEGLLSSMTYDGATGLMETQTDPIGVTTLQTYDEFNVPIRKDVYQENNSNNIIEQPTETSVRNCDITYCGNQEVILNNIMNKLNADVPENLGEYFRRSDGYKVPELAFVSQIRKEGSSFITSWLDQSGRIVLSRTEHSGDDAYVLSLVNSMGQNELTTEPFEVENNDFKGVTGRNIPYYTFNIYDQRGRLAERYVDLGSVNDAVNGSCKRGTVYTTIMGQTEVSATISGCPGTQNTGLQMFRSYDSAGQLLQTVDAEKHITHYWYDSAGQPYKVLDAQNNAITTRFDNLGRKTSVDDPNMGTKEFAYNSFGEIVFEQDAVQADDALPINTANYTYYDENGRITYVYNNVAQIASPGEFQPINGIRSTMKSFTYSGPFLVNQRLLSNSFGNNAGYYDDLRTYFTYDEFGRIIEEEAIFVNDGDRLNLYGFQDLDSKIEYFYYQNHNLLKQKLYSYVNPINVGSHQGYSIVNHYDVYGSLVKQVDNPRSSTLMTIDGHNLRGQPTQRTLYSYHGSNTMETEFYYYPSTGQPRTIKHGDASRTNSQVFNYAYDGWGNILNQSQEIDGSIVSETFTYDSLQRLISSLVSNQNQINYGYDDGGLGNLEHKSDYASQQFYAKTGNAGPNAITSVNLSSGGSISYGYDLKGNRISANNNSYDYDANNLMIKSMLENGDQVEFRYGVDNMRYWKHELSTNQDGNLVEETTLYMGPEFELLQNHSTGELQTKFVLADYLTVTRKTSGSLDYHFLQTDRLGSTSQILNGTGNRVATKGYDAFGKPRNGDDWSPMTEPALNFENENSIDSRGVDITKRGFTNHEHLDSFELIHMNGRMYDFNNGRFLSVDPFIQGTTSQAINPYSYIHNNPLSGTDPTGYAIDTLFDAANIVYDLGKIAVGEISGNDELADEGYEDLVADTAAVLIPFVPAGATKVARAGKEGVETAVDSSKGAKAAVDNGGEKLAKKSDAGGDTSDLKNRADEVHGELDETAQRFRTTAATEAVDDKGNKTVIISSSEKRLSKQQREALKDGEIEGTSTVRGEHAEATGIRVAKEKGLTPTATAASRPICQNCQKVIKENNVEPKSPLKKPPKKPVKKPEDETLK